jgi:hypothetical protein
MATVGRAGFQKDGVKNQIAIFLLLLSGLECRGMALVNPSEKRS